MKLSNILIENVVKPRNLIGSAIRADEIPLKYREKYQMIGRGSTSLVFKYDDDNVLVFTRDNMKEEWIRIALQMSEYIEEFEVRGVSRIRGMSNIPIAVFKMPMLYPLNSANKKIVMNEIDRFYTILSKIRNDPNKRRYYNTEILNYYYDNYPDSILIDVLEWFGNYDISQFHFDLLPRNFMQNREGNIIPVDPVVSTEIYNLITQK